MQAVKNKIHIVITIFWLTLGISLIVFSIIKTIEEKSAIGIALLSFLGPLMILLFYFVMKILLFIPLIELNNRGIKIKNKRKETFLNWSEIESIDFNDRNGFFREEAIKIITKNKKQKTLIYRKHFSNFYAISQAINYMYKDKGEPHLNKFIPIEILPVKYNSIRFEKVKYITQSPFVSYRTYIPLFSLVIVYTIFKNDHNPIQSLLIISPVILLLISIGLFGISKVGLSDEYLRVENIYLSFGKTFRLNDINEVFIETPHSKAPNSIRVITNDSKSNLIAIANYTNKTWKYLEQELIRKGIKVTKRI